MTDTHPDGPEPAHSAFRVLAALADLGEATAATIATACGLGYSTVTPKLRAWEDTGQAERFRAEDNQTRWRLTATGRAATTNTAPTTEPPAHDGGHSPTAADSPGTVKQPRQASPTEAADTSAADAADHQESEQAGPAPSEQADPAPDVPQSQAETTPTPLGPSPGSDAAAKPAAAEPDGQPDPSNDQHVATSGDGDAPSEASGAPQRRSSGSLRGAILDVLEAHDGPGLKVAELCKLVDAANKDTGARKASAGAVSNAAHKLVATGSALLIAEKPATFARIRAGS